MSVYPHVEKDCHERTEYTDLSGDKFTKDRKTKFLGHRSPGKKDSSSSIGDLGGITCSRWVTPRQCHGNKLIRFVRIT